MNLHQIYFWQRPGTPPQTVMPTAINNGTVTLAVVTNYPGYGGGPGHQEVSELRLLESYLDQQCLEPLDDGEGLKGKQKREAVEYAAAIRDEFCSLVFGRMAGA